MMRDNGYLKSGVSTIPKTDVWETELAYAGYVWATDNSFLSFSSLESV